MHYLFLMVAGMMMGGILTASLSLTNADTSQEIHHESLTTPFQQAGQQIEDPETKAYYELLMENISPHLASADTTGSESYLPDIEGTYHESLTTPFQQAGQQIEDPEIKAFYDRLIGKSGLDK